MKKILIVVGMLLVSSAVFAEEPEWYGNPPKDAKYYYFSGVGRGSSEVAARNMAQGDVFAQIVYMINASVTSNSSMETMITENMQEAKKESAIYKKVRAKGDAKIENYEEVKKASEKEKGADGKTIYIQYVLAKIPKGEVEKAKERAEKEKQDKKNNPMGIFAVAVFPNGSIMEIDVIKSQVEDLYNKMGFSIKAVDIEFTPDVFKSQGKLVKFLQEKAGSEVKKVVVAVVTSSGLRQERQGDLAVTGLLGDLIVRQIDLSTGEVLSTTTISSKGVSLRKDASRVEDAFKKLIKNLTKEFFESSEEGGGGKKDDAI